MNALITVLKAFNGSLITPQGEFPITRFFPTLKAAKKACYSFSFMYQGTIVCERRAATGAKRYAVIGK